MSRPPNNSPGRSQALSGRDITGTINALAAQKDVDQAYQQKTTTSTTTTATTKSYRLIGIVNGVNKAFSLPVTTPNGYAIFSDGVQLVAGAGYISAGQSITMTVAPVNSATVLVF